MRFGQVGHGGRRPGRSIRRQVDDPLRRERDVRGVEGAVGERGAQCGLGAGTSGHLEVHARRHRRGTVGRRSPVAHDDPVEAPLLAQNLGEQPACVGRVIAVDAVVGGHDHARDAVAQGELEAAQVHLAQGALVDDRVDHETPVLLIVDGEVLEARTDARALNASHGASSQPAAQQRVFAVVLEVAAAQRVPLDVQARAEHDVDAEGARFAADGFADLVHELLVPAAREGRGRRKARGRHAAREPQVVCGLELGAQAVRAISEHDATDAPLGQRAGAPEVGSRQQRELLVDRQL